MSVRYRAPSAFLTHSFSNARFLFLSLLRRAAHWMQGFFTFLLLHPRCGADREHTPDTALSVAGNNNWTNIGCVGLANQGSLTGYKA